MKPRFRAELEVSSEELCILASWFFESDEQEFSLRGVNSKKISSGRRLALVVVPCSRMHAYVVYRS